MTNQVKQLFIEHPATVGESYFEHLFVALRFSMTMLVGTLACFVHAIFPFLCIKTGSKIIDQLHDDMVAKRHTMSE